MAEQVFAVHDYRRGPCGRTRHAPVQHRAGRTPCAGRA
ncbi:UNVERIFIED_CONTAM: hypothetical protein GTU68_005017 [Idotea baltica]|nr:hypothetical protein [Idotea baltica]